ncbi:unnamed protein product [Nesidiocoris tenuis]|uniref:Uncharacterized protein n=1 Tax=Nesidiocoris tenuis TaxID=355587 RepID=A0A6H5HAH8_9HEMI|nr:unnamed protein product [Nesidiocoris tenuis]
MRSSAEARMQRPADKRSQNSDTKPGRHAVSWLLLKFSVDGPPQFNGGMFRGPLPPPPPMPPGPMPPHLGPPGMPAPPMPPCIFFSLFCTSFCLDKLISSSRAIDALIQHKRFLQARCRQVLE